MVLKNTNPAFKYVDWPVQNALAFTTSRLHPNSARQNISFTSPYDHFNLGTHVGESKAQTLANRTALIDFLPNVSSKPTSIQWLNQVHGNEVLTIETVSADALTADAMVTREKNIALAVMTADCLPILLSSENGDEIAAIHGGWRPLAQNIIKNTLAKMQCENKFVHAWLGPCIGASVFEVGVEVKQTFVEQNQNFALAFIQHNHDKYLANLHQIATLQLQQLGVSNIKSLAECTFSNPQRYYSYRRENITGRMASIITRL